MWLPGGHSSWEPAAWLKFCSDPFDADNFIWDADDVSAKDVESAAFFVSRFAAGCLIVDSGASKTMASLQLVDEYQHL